MTVIQSITRTASMINTKTGIVTTYSTPHRVFFHDMSRPVSSKRTKPRDLFAGGTARTVTEIIEEFADAVASNRFNEVWSGPSSGLNSVFTNLNDFPAPVNPSDYSDLDAKCRLKIKSQLVNLANAAAEYDQTAKSVTKLAGEIASALRSIRSGRAGTDLVRLLTHRNTRNGRNAANRWLELQYGLLPLMSDIYGSAEALRKKLTNGMHIHATSTSKEQFTGTYPRTYGIESILINQNRKVHARCVVSSASIKQLSEVGITNPALVVWELVPYSFVIDWACGVGDWLNGLDALLGTSGLVVQRGYKRTIKHDLPLDKPNPNSWDVSVRGHCRRQENVTRRLAMGTTLGFGFPQLKNPITVGHMLNALALIRQMKF